MDLFDNAALDDAGIPAVLPSAPLAVRMRPTTLSELAGQRHLLEPGSPLHRLVTPEVTPQGAGPSSVILWGPPGTGKTTLAYLIARASQRRFAELSAVTAGVKDVRDIVAQARRLLTTSGAETVLFIDEVHRFTKAQQDALLPAVENRWVTLVAATTENPSFSVISPLLSRSLLLTLRPLDDDDVAHLIHRALADERGLNGQVKIEDDAVAQLVRLAGSDARKALTMLEAAAGAVLDTDDPNIDLEAVAAATDTHAVRYDRAGDQHYDVISAFIKSMRGSDVDGALHYLGRMIAAGEDPRFIARRVIIAAAEDVGMADPTALQTAVAAAQAVQMIGMPEGRIPLAQAVVHVATAPKSNRVYKAVDAAIADVRAGNIGTVPLPLRDAHYAGAKKLGHGEEYKYSHDYPHGIAPQEFLPEPLRGRRYYEPTGNGHEANITARLERINALLRPEHKSPRNQQIPKKEDQN